MTKYQMDDGRLVETDQATKSWEEETTWNGNNHISVNTGSQWDHERLHLSSKGHYYLEEWSQWQGSIPSARWADDEEAARWLLRNEKDLPAELARFEGALVE